MFMDLSEPGSGDLSETPLPPVTRMLVSGGSSEEEEGTERTYGRSEELWDWGRRVLKHGVKKARKIVRSMLREDRGGSSREGSSSSRGQGALLNRRFRDDPSTTGGLFQGLHGSSEEVGGGSDIASHSELDSTSTSQFQPRQPLPPTGNSPNSSRRFPRPHEEDTHIIGTRALQRVAPATSSPGKLSLEISDNENLYYILIAKTSTVLIRHQVSILRNPNLENLDFRGVSRIYGKLRIDQNAKLSRISMPVCLFVGTTGVSSVEIVFNGDGATSLLGKIAMTGLLRSQSGIAVADNKKFKVIDFGNMEHTGITRGASFLVERNENMKDLLLSGRLQKTWLMFSLCVRRVFWSNATRK